MIVVWLILVIADLKVMKCNSNANYILPLTTCNSQYEQQPAINRDHNDSYC